MPQIPRETVEQVLAATDIVDVISSYIPVKRAGTRFQALCPFHNEKTPSFSIDPAHQFFHCFGCKKSGDAIHFVRELENLTFTDAVKKLAARVNMTVIEETLDPREERDRQARGRLLDLHREASRFFHSLLLRSTAAAHARDYLKSRGFGKEMAVRWEVGWAPDAPAVFLDWAREHQFRGRDLVDSGLALQRDGGGLFPRFRDRLMFPIRNDHGDVIAFSGRQLREDPRSGKYINSPETPLFRKSNVLFALDKARKAILDHKAALVCEGQMDAVACHEAGLPHAIAGLGTAFTPEHAKRLRRYTKTAILLTRTPTSASTAPKPSPASLPIPGISSISSSTAPAPMAGWTTLRSAPPLPPSVRPFSPTSPTPFPATPCSSTSPPGCAPASPSCAMPSAAPRKNPPSRPSAAVTTNPPKSHRPPPPRSTAASAPSARSPSAPPPCSIGSPNNSKPSTTSPPTSMASPSFRPSSPVGPIPHRPLPSMPSSPPSRPINSLPFARNPLSPIPFRKTPSASPKPP
ncbi:MAG: DNA primase, partial [Akkermansiaceae bacterium]|nr:DNA primase [Akkermansiaceae bacterium]